jgi:hypothetical protein
VFWWGVYFVGLSFCCLETHGSSGSVAFWKSFLDGVVVGVVVSVGCEGPTLKSTDWFTLATIGFCSQRSTFNVHGSAKVWLYNPMPHASL